MRYKYWCYSYLENYTQQIDINPQLRYANYSMFISETGYFTVSELDLKGKLVIFIKTIGNIWPIYDPGSTQSWAYNLPSFDMPSSAIMIQIGKIIRKSIGIVLY